MNKFKLKYEGQTKVSPNGSVATIIEYINSSNCVIRMGSGYEYTISSSAFNKGHFKDPNIILNKRKSRSNNIIVGVGNNDLREGVFNFDGSKNVPFIKWSSMLNRCYSNKYQKDKTSYIGCAVCDDWLIYSRFKDWITSQDYIDKELDKDLLCKDNKIYSSETCVMLEPRINSFISIARSDLPHGVSLKKQSNKYVGRVQNPFSGKREHLGYFQDPLEAHKAWQTRKHELACELAKTQSDPRVAKALRERYAPDKDWSKY